jgi:hypothetical protein
MRALFVFAVVASLALAGCTKPVDFAPAVAALATGAKDAQSAFADLDAKAAQAERRSDLSKIVRLKPRVATEGGCQNASSGCALVVDLDGRRLDLGAPPEKVAAKQHAILDALVVYTQNLGALAVADSKEEIDAQAAKISAAITAAAAVVPGGAPIAAIAIPAGDALAWLLGVARDRVRLAVLRDATAKMQSVLARAAHELAQSGQSLDTKLREQALAEFDANEVAWHLRPTVAALEKWIASSLRLDAIIKSKSGQSFAALADAHQALVQVLQNPPHDLASLVKDIDRFADLAKQAAKFAKEIREAANAAQS